MDKLFHVKLGIRLLIRLGMVWILGVLLFGACHYPEPDLTRWDLSRNQRDSLEFCATHHYGTNFNFKVTADSLLLRQVMEPDSLVVRRGDVLVVADFVHADADSIDTYWIQVARDQETMGWIDESVLLENVVPVDPISQFIHLFTSWRTVLFLVVCGCFVLFYLYRRLQSRMFRIIFEFPIDSFYPTLFCLCVVLSATIYASMQRFVPETWEHYYYNPSLNPFDLPFILTLFMISVWAIVLVALALVDDIFHQVSFSTAFFYLLGLGTLCLFFYLIVNLTVYYYVGYLFVGGFVWIAIKRLCRKASNNYVCGHCGMSLHRPGVCPRCGYLNK